MGAPCKNTCPDIDKVIKKIKSALKSAEEGKKYEEEAAICCDDIIDDLWDIEGILEDLRSDNSALRDWGHQTEAELNNALEECERLQQQVDELKNPQ